MIIKNGIVADPASGLYEHMDILVKDGKIVVKRRLERGTEVVEGKLPLAVTENGTAPDCRTWTYRHSCAFP